MNVARLGLRRAAVRPVRIAGRRNTSHAAPVDPANTMADVSPEVFKSAAAKAYFAEQEAVIHHSVATAQMWRRITYYFALPLIGVIAAYVVQKEQDHFAHIEHEKHENGGELPATPAYDYIDRRSRPFPWGMNSLFFNPKVQADLSLEE